MEQLVVITGASSGIGYELARELLKSSRSLHVLGIARQKQPLEELQNQDSRFSFVVGDLTEERTISRLVQRIQALLGVSWKAGLPGRVEERREDTSEEGMPGRMRSEKQAPLSLVQLEEREYEEISEKRDVTELVLVLNAGVLLSESWKEADLTAFEQIFKLHVFSPFQLLTATLPYFKWSNKGKILVMSSPLGIEGVHDVPLYVSSKHALEGLIKSLRHELFGYKVEILVVRPDDVKTGLFSPFSAPEHAIDVHELAHLLSTLLFQRYSSLTIAEIRITSKQ